MEVVHILRHCSLRVVEWNEARVLLRLGHWRAGGEMLCDLHISKFVRVCVFCVCVCVCVNVCRFQFHQNVSQSA